MTLTPGMKVAVFVITLGAAALAADLIWMVPGRIPAPQLATPVYQPDATDATANVPTQAASSTDEARKTF